VISVPLIRTVADRTVRSVRTSLLIDTPGPVLQIPADRERGVHHGQVRSIASRWWWKIGRGAQVALVHPERLLNLPQVMMGGDDRCRVHAVGQAGW
jgi:hypothetical protein